MLILIVLATVFSTQGANSGRKKILTECGFFTKLKLGKYGQGNRMLQ
jgi:hypothetical protein